MTNSQLCPKVNKFSRTKIYLQRLDGREFRGGSDNKMRRMWLGWENVVDFPSLAHQWQEIEIGSTVKEHALILFLFLVVKFVVLKALTNIKNQV